MVSPSHALEPAAASGLRRLAVPSARRASTVQRERWAPSLEAFPFAAHVSRCDG
jgi:hypothetical protein